MFLTHSLPAPEKISLPEQELPTVESKGTPSVACINDKLLSPAPSVVDVSPLKARKISPCATQQPEQSSEFAAAGIVLRKWARQPPLIIVDKIASDEACQPKRTDKTHQLHLGAEVLGQGVYTAPSTRPGAGLGLFAAREFAVNTLITECVGETISIPPKSRKRKLLWDRIGNSYESWSHLIEISDHEVLRCEQVPQFGQGGGSFANDSRPGAANARFVRIRDEQRGTYRIFVKALQPVDAGVEITVSYGDGYWHSFREEFPERYESMFGEKLFQIEGWDQQWQKMQADGRKKYLVTLLNQKMPVPHWPELKEQPKQWDVSLATYALYKYGRLSPARLSPAALALLRPESDHYFTAIGEYFAHLKKGGRNINKPWSRYNGSRSSLNLPCNPVFRADLTAWCASHFHVLYRFFNPGRYVQQVSGRKNTSALMSLLGVVSHQHPLYEQLATEYIFRAMCVGSGQVLNFNEPVTKKRLKRLSNNLGLAGVPPPLLVCGRPLGKRNTWCVDYIRELLHRKGVQVIQSGMGIMSPFRQLDMLFDCSDDIYREGLLSLCRERNCQFGVIVQHANQSRCAGIRFRPIVGVRFDRPRVDRHGLYFQYVHYVGVDTQEVCQQSSIRTLSQCIRMIGKKYRGRLSQKELLAMLFSRLNLQAGNSDQHNLGQVVGEIREYLHGDLRFLADQELYDQLQPLAEQLKQEHQHLPWISAANTYSQKSG